MKTLILISSLFVGYNAYAIKISDMELYQRCHAHLTGEAPAFNDPVMASIISKKVSGLSACKSLLKMAELKGNSPLPKSNVTGIKILENFFNVHASWFESKIFEGDLANTREVHEFSPGGLYFTKALFDTNFKYSDIFQNENSLEAIRSDGSPTTTNRGRTLAEVQHLTVDDIIVPWSNVVIPQTGVLEGIRNETPLYINSFRNLGKTIVNGSMGGGILGNRNYILRTTKERFFNADGAVRMPRRWGRSIFVDFLCQELPVINTGTDAEPFVDPVSSTPFRTTSGCVSCHASMDQLSGLVRNFNAPPIANNDTQLAIATFHPTTITAAYSWRSNRDVNYFKKTPHGKFYYRTIDGQLINRNLETLSALGNLMSQLDDTYMCTASRYLEHFTGVNFPIKKVSKDRNHIYSKAIRSLANDLKTSQSPMVVIEKIMSSTIYNDSNFLIWE